LWDGIKELVDLYGTMNLSPNSFCEPDKLLQFASGQLTDGHLAIIRRMAEVQTSAKPLSYNQQEMLLKTLLSVESQKPGAGQKLVDQFLSFSTNEECYGKEFPLENLCEISKFLTAEQMGYFEQYVATINKRYSEGNLNSDELRELNRMVSIFTASTVRNQSTVSLYYLGFVA
jgi:hypothetical protein